MKTNQQLIKLLINQGYLKTPLIIEVFEKIDRADFVLEEFKDEAYNNYPLPIGYGQTISQPATVAFMLELLEPKPGHKILDIGSGSGWQTAMLAYIVMGRNNVGTNLRVRPGQTQGSAPTKNNIGKIFAIERLPELKEFGEENVSKYNFINKGIVKFICADGSKGLPKQAPFDRIIAAASAEEMPHNLKKQLCPNGRLVLPIKNSIWLITKQKEKEYPGFVFVPLIKQ